MISLPIMVQEMLEKGRSENKIKLRKWKIYFLSYRVSLEKLRKKILSFEKIANAGKSQTNYYKKDFTVKL